MPQLPSTVDGYWTSSRAGAGRTRCRPNTVLAAASDLRVFFAVVGKRASEVRPLNVLRFITAQRTGRSEDQRPQPASAEDEHGAVATSTVARRLSMFSGFFAYLQARG